MKGRKNYHDNNNENLTIQQAFGMNKKYRPIKGTQKRTDALA